MPNEAHEHWMRRALALTVHAPLLPFGAVIVDPGSQTLIAEGWNRTDENPLWHGEIVAINRLAASTPNRDGAGLALYTTAEPCPMCMGAIMWAGIDTLVFGTSIPTLMRLGWRQFDLRADELARRAPAWRMLVIGGVLEADCDALFRAARS